MNILQKINVNFRENRLLYLLVLAFFSIGIVLGAYTVKYMSPKDSTDLANYYTSFTQSLGTNSISSTGLLFEVLKNNIITILIILAVSLTIFGSPVVLLIDLAKGYTLGYTFSFLITTFNGKGLGVALASSIPQNIFYIPFFIGISILAIEISSVKFKERVFSKGGKGQIVVSELIAQLSVLFIIFIVGVIVEVYASPSLIKFVVTKFYS